MMKDRLIAQHEETILWQAKRIAELLDASQPPAPAPATQLREQEPVAWQDTVKPTELIAAEDWDNIDPMYQSFYQPLYTSPPAQRQARSADTWVVPDALTAHDPETLEYRTGWNDCRQAVMEMLKEKNT